MADQFTSQIGIGLLDISALTAIIGSATAESLILGNRGAAGLPWATMSIFGLISVIKACFGAIVPCSFRESLGVRNRAVDLAVGMFFDLDSKYKGLEQQVKEDLGGAVGIVCLRKQRDTNTEGGLQKKYNEVYAFDQLTLNQMRTVRMSNLGEDVEEYMSYNDQRRKGPNIKLDWIYLFGSLVKLIETFVLWKLGAAILWFSSSLPWLYFFVCAVILQQRELSRGYRKNLDKGELDILAGELPTILKGGGKRQILLGAPQNFRHNKPWKIVWIFGTVVCTSSLILTYAILGRQDTTIVYVWLSLQVVWLILRSAYFQTAEGTDTSHFPFGKGKNSEEVPSQSVLKERVLDLMFALAKYRANIHHEDLGGTMKILHHLQS